MPESSARLENVPLSISSPVSVAAVLSEPAAENLIRLVALEIETWRTHRRGAVSGRLIFARWWLSAILQYALRPWNNLRCSNIEAWN